MVKIRLQRYGTTKRPYYRIVAADSRARRDGRFLEIVGTYEPTKQPAEIKLDKEKIVAWIDKGAQPTDTVKSILRNAGIIKELADQKLAKQKEKKETK